MKRMIMVAVFALFLLPVSVQATPAEAQLVLQVAAGITGGEGDEQQGCSEEADCRVGEDPFTGDDVMTDPPASPS